MSILVAIVASIAGVAFFAAVDQKRGRAVGDKRAQGSARLKWSARALVFAPGVVLAALGAWSPFAIWLGAVTVIGWGVAAMPVGGWERAVAWLHKMLSKSLHAAAKEFIALSSQLKRLASPSGTSRRFRELEARIEALEAELLQLKRNDRHQDEREAA